MNLHLFPLPISQESFTASSLMLNALKETKYFLVEHPRTARRFISELSLDINIQELKFFTLNKKTSKQELHQQLTEWSKETQQIGVMSEAGCPGIADPGALAVEWAHQNEINVKAYVGPASIFLALMASGANGQSFAFNGYLPIKNPQRSKTLLFLEKRALQGQSQIFIETPYRNLSLFEFLCKSLHEDTKLCLAANLTAQDEFVKTLSIKQWKKKEQPPIHKKPCVFILV